MKLVAGVLAAVVCVGGILAFYRWTANSTGLSHSFAAKTSYDRYNQLVDGFDAGRLDLPLPVPPGLAGLADPYDPAANAPFRATGYQDLVYRNGKLYIYWGPAPAVTLFWPSRALGLGRFPQVYAVALFAALAFVCAAGLLWTLVRRFVPETPPWMLLIGVVALGGGGVWPWLIRRPEVYEVAIAAASAFVFAGLWLLAAGGLGPRVRPVPVALGALCLGLAIGSRPSMGLALALPVAWLAWRRTTDTHTRWVRSAAALVLPLLACAIALMVYNERRFGSPLDFGRGYLLLSPDDARQGSSLANLPGGLWFYLLGGLHFTPSFPFFHVELPAGGPFHLPDGWTVRERVGGVLLLQPLVLLLLAGPLLWRRLRPAALVAGLLAGVAAALLVFDAFYVNGVVQRYEADFVSLLLVAALLVWAGLWATEPRPLLRRTIGWTGASLALFGAAAGLLLSMSGPNATLPYAWENLAPHLMFLAPLGRSFGWDGPLHQAWLLVAVLGVAGAIGAGAAWAGRRAGLESRRAWIAGLAVTLAGATAALLAILLPRGDAATDPFGTGRTIVLALGLAAAAAGGGLSLSRAGPRPRHAGTRATGRA